MDPHLTQTDGFHPGDKTYSHPSFGMVSFGRVSSGGGQAMFGSSLRHSELISLEIRHAEHTRKGIGYDTYMAKEPIVRIHLTPTQFANAITTLNTEGTPCTIVRLLNKSVPGMPELESKQDEARRELKDRLWRMADDFKTQQARVTELIDRQKPPTKAELREVLAVLDAVQAQLRSNIPHYAEMFEEVMDKAVAEAKGQVEAFVQSRINELGLQQIQQQGLPGAPGAAAPVITLALNESPTP